MVSCLKGIWISAVAVLVLGCSKPGSVNDEPQNPADRTHTSAGAATSLRPDKLSVGPFRFVDVASSVGIHFRHYSPLTEQRHVHLVMGSGIGWFDLDRDGWPDLYCCQGAALAGNLNEVLDGRTRRPSYARPGTPFDGGTNDERPGNAFFRNNEGEAFSEVTRQAGLLDTGYSMGIASADYDNDGFADLCLTGYEVNTLLHNNGDGTFTPVELPLGTSSGRLSASCAWGDFDGDGNLDLYITNYAKLGPEDYPICEHTGAGATIHIACHPSNLERMADLLYRNTGDGQFVDASKAAGIVDGSGRQGLGVIAADLDQDGDTDFYVANDTTPNYLWENRGDGQFADRGADSGTATNRHGAREASMGVAVGDVTGNGRFDLFVTNFHGETNTLYRNEGSLLFSDVTDETGLGAPSRLRLAFGASFADFDNDGWLDLLAANGHIHDRLHEIGRDGSFAQLAQVFYNDRGSRFQDVSAACGPYFLEPHVGRGTAIADFDRDGDSDIAINHLNNDLVLLQNEAEDIGQWLRIELVGIQSNRDGIGSVLRIDLGDRMLFRSAQAGGSYLSCDETALLIGLGSLEKVREVIVIWPGGRQESWNDLSANRLWRLVEGSGRDSNTR